MEENPPRKLVPFHFLWPPGRISPPPAVVSCSFMHTHQLPSLPCLISSWGYSHEHVTGLKALSQVRAHAVYSLRQ